MNEYNKYHFFEIFVYIYCKFVLPYNLINKKYEA